MYFKKLKGVGRVGDGGVRLPTKIKKSRSIIGFDMNCRMGRPFEENLFFKWRPSWRPCFASALLKFNFFAHI